MLCCAVLRLSLILKGQYAVATPAEAWVDALLLGHRTSPTCCLQDLNMCAYTCLAQGLYLVAEGAASADAWVDALLLSKYIVQSRSNQAMADALAPASSAAGWDGVGQPQQGVAAEARA